MADATQQAPLPPSVEEMIRRICEKYGQPPLDAVAREGLNEAGEEIALYILREIGSLKNVYKFSGLIMYMLKKYRSGDTKNSNESPQKRVCTRQSDLNSGGLVDSHPQDNLVDHRSLATTLSDRLEIPQYVALGELEFRKAFLILSYIGEKKLEQAISADDIRKLKDLTMEKFESKVWEALGSHYIEKEDRRKSVDWESGKTHTYHCHISLDGTQIFKGPYLVHYENHLQRELGDDNILLVTFEKSKRSSAINFYYMKYNKVAREGILVGLRLYRFFVFKDGGKEDTKKDPNSSSVRCYFVRMNSNAAKDQDQQYILSKKNIHEARSVFMHLHTLPSMAKYMPRLKLVLSKSVKVKVDLGTVNVVRIEDISCRDKDGKEVYQDGKLLIHTDGTGFISQDLASKCSNNVLKGKCTTDGKSKPLLMQVRLFKKGCAVKGTLLVNKKLPPRTIQVRPSMIKVEADPNLSDTHVCNSLELVKTSTQPKNASLSKYLIALLSYGGVPASVFEDIAKNSLEDLQGGFTNRQSALRASLNYEWMDNFLVTKMILSGIPLDEPCLQGHLSTMMKTGKNNIRGGKLPITDSYYLMGTVDPTGTLNRDEVCIILNDGQVSWEKVLVYRNPALHFGDIHVLKAVYVKELEEIVGNAKFAVFFPCKGARSLADEIAGGDYDGDMYFVSRNPELLKHFKKSEPWVSASSPVPVSSKRPSEYSADELEDQLFKIFLTTTFQPSRAISEAADGWLAIMDRLLTLGEESADEKAAMKQNMLRLIDIYYDALDAPKSGTKIEVPGDLRAERFPHYMERKESFNSKSVLGKIYDMAMSYEPQDLSLKEIKKLPCFDDEVPEPCMEKWRPLYKRYKSEMSRAINSKSEEDTNEVIEKYKKILYEAEELEQSPRSIDEIYNEALAIYHLAYDCGMRFANEDGKQDFGKCNFAWKVAGSALCKLHALKKGETTMLCIPSVLKEIFS